MFFIQAIRIFFLLFLILSFLLIIKCNKLCNHRINNYSSAVEVGKIFEIIRVKIGQKANLPCFIKNLSSSKVIWVKNGDILALGTSKISIDSRLNVQQKYLNEWHLTIENVVPDDEGEFICKTNGNFFKTIKLQVLG